MMNGLVSTCIAIALISASGVALADADLDEAKKLGATAPPGTDVSYVPATGPLICVGQPVCDRTPPSWYLGKDVTKVRKAAAGALGVSPVGSMGMQLLAVPEGTPGSTPPQGPPTLPDATQKAACDLTAPKGLADCYLQRPATTFDTAHSGAGSETLQILGQIVADRASGAALELVLKRIKTQLKCKDTTPETPRTCELVEKVRLQDLAGTGDALLLAVVSDSLHLLKAHAKKQAGGDAKAIDAGFELLEDALSELLRNRRGLGGTSAGNLPRRILEDALRAVSTGTSTTLGVELKALPALRGQRTLLTAALAYARCSLPNGNDPPSITECPTAVRVRESATALGLPDDGELLARAEDLLTRILAAQTLRSGTDQPVWRERAIHAVDATFDAMCLLVDTSTDKATKMVQCPADVPARRPATVAGWLSLGHYFVASALEGDLGGILIGASTVVGEDQRKGMRLLGGVLRYAASYSGSAASGAQAHEDRTKLLEDLTKDMTDRTGREGDDVWSLGGALALTAGGRVPLEEDEKAAVYGPVALPLGIGFQTVGGGLHFMAGFFDLGQYISWKPGLEVAEPDVEDALCPSLTLGYSWGTSFPAFVAASVSYAPHYRFSDSSNRGSLNVGANLGVYVPLLDIN